MHEKHLYGRGPGGFHCIAYTEWGQPSAQPPVICVHGLVRNGRDFDYLARALGADGRQVFCPDIVGRGKSDWLTNPADYTYSQYLMDMTALIARTGGESVDWIGTSMGGLLGRAISSYSVGRGVIERARADERVGISAYGRETPIYSRLSAL